MFTERFCLLLQENKLSMYAVSKNTGISQTLLSQYKEGIKKPTIINLVKIADFFNVSIDYLLERTDKREINK